MVVRPVPMALLGGGVEALPRGGKAEEAGLVLPSEVRKPANTYAQRGVSLRAMYGQPSLVILTPRPPPSVPLPVFLVCLQLHAPWLAPASSSATRESRLEWISRSSRRKDSRDSIHSADFDFGEEEDAAAANGLHPPSSGGR